MPHPPPDHRARRMHAAATAEAGECPNDADALERDLFHLVKHQTTALPEVLVAAELYHDPEYSHVVNAIALAGASPSDVADGLRMAPTVYQAYCHLFFDPTVFDHALAAARYVARLDVSKELRKQYEDGMAHGPMVLLNRFRIGARPRVDPEDVLYGVCGDAWEKFLSHRGFTATSEMAQAALRYGQVAVASAKMIVEKSAEDKKANNAMQDIKIALEIRDHTKTPDELGIKPGELVVK